jgi:hypothetical protein
MASNGIKTKAVPFKPPPPPPKKGPAFLLKVKGCKPLPFNDLIICLRELRLLRFNRPGLSAVVVRVVDNVVMAFTVKENEEVKEASSNAHSGNAHVHRPNAQQTNGKRKP